MTSALKRPRLEEAGESPEPPQTRAKLSSTATPTIQSLGNNLVSAPGGPGSRVSGGMPPVPTPVIVDMAASGTMPASGAVATTSTTLTLGSYLVLAPRGLGSRVSGGVPPAPTPTAVGMVVSGVVPASGATATTSTTLGLGSNLVPAPGGSGSHVSGDVPPAPTPVAVSTTATTSTTLGMGSNLVPAHGGCWILREWRHAFYANAGCSWHDGEWRRNRERCGGGDVHHLGAGQ